MPAVPRGALPGLASDRHHERTREQMHGFGKKTYGVVKPTTIGMLTTLVVPTSGQAEVGGLDVARRPVEVKRRIGMVSQHNTADTDLTVAENLEFRGRYFGPSGPAGGTVLLGWLAMRTFTAPVLT